MSILVDEEHSKEQILQELKEAIKEVNLGKQGKIERNYTL